MNEVIQSFIEDPSTEKNKLTALPAANSTSGFQISAGYMRVIVAIYAIVVVLVIFIIIIIVTHSIRNSWRRYGAIPRQRFDGLDPDVEILDGNTRVYGPHQDNNDSEFDNISLDRDRGAHEDNESDVPPLYENPPSYLDSGHLDNRETYIPPSYENPPSYLSINR